MSYSLETIVARAKRKGFAYPGSEIYGGLANARDLGPYGTELRRNIIDARWKHFVQERADMVGLDASILMNPKVWEASGHVAGFSDPLVDCKKCKARERADKLIEEEIQEMKEEKRKYYFTLAQNNAPGIDASIQEFEATKHLLHREVSELEKKLEEAETESERAKLAEEIKEKKKHIYIGEMGGGVGYSLELLVDNSLKMKILEAIGLVEKKENETSTISEGIAYTPEARTFEQQTAFLNAFKVKCPECGAVERTEPKKFNLMFKTQQGVIDGEGRDIYLRPETAQGIFVNFKNILDTTRVRIPFGIAQIGKSFRNEITPGNFMFRVREFEQMEIEYFVEDDIEIGLKTLQDWKESSEEWRIEKIGIKKEKLRFREHDPKELAFYSKGTRDVEYDFPRGRGELQGIAYRTDYDLKQHQEYSGKDLQYTDPMTGKRYLPHCVEPSRGLTRAILTAMIDAYDEEEYTNQKGEKETRIVARFHTNIAPVKFAILPLVKKDEQQVKIGLTLFRSLSKKCKCEYDDNGAIGKRYRRQDEIGTPYCVTIDQQSLEDGTVTIRDRDTMQQRRVSVEEIESTLYSVL